MYWIYLIIFVLAILVPDLVPHNSKALFFQEEQLEEALIFILGLTGFLIFRWKEKQSIQNLEERIKIQKEARLVSRNLTDTYSYIGETNRKLDIITNVSLNLSELDPKREKKFFDSLLEAINMLTKSNKFVIRFIDTENQKTEKEIKSRKKLVFKLTNEEIIKSFKAGKNFVETDYYFIVTSPKEVDGLVSAIIISKNNQQQKMEDPEMIKGLASQALVFHFNTQKKKD